MKNELSDNSDEWPISPFELLGVPITAEKSEIRRAYSALIRRFRPETHPKQFQRVREAFESALAAIETRSQNTSDIRIDLTSLVPPDNTTAAAIASESSIPQTAETSRISDRLEIIWDRFSNQPDRSQYEELCHDLSSNERSAESFLMAYWMLRLRPDFDENARPANLLTQSLEYFGAEPRLVNLLVDEYRRDHSLTDPQNQSDPAGYILSSELLCIYLMGRWNILGQRRAWAQLSNEVDQARARLAFDHSDAWFRLLSRVYEMVIFAKDDTGKALFATVQQEVTAVNTANNQRFATLDMLDMLEVIRQNQGSFSSRVSPALQQLLLNSANLTPDSFRRQLFGLIRGWMDSPLEALDNLTELAVHLPEAFWLLLHQADGLDFFDTMESTRDTTIPDVVARMVDSCKFLDYGEARIVVAEFCRDECLSGTALVSALVELSPTKKRAEELANALQSDTPLLLTCQMISRFLEACEPRQND